MEELPPSPSTWVHIFPALRDSRKHLSGNHYSKALAEFLLALSMCSFFAMSSKKGREGTTCRTSNVIANGASSALPESSHAHMSSSLDNWPHAASLVKDCSTAAGQQRCILPAARTCCHASAHKRAQGKLGIDLPSLGSSDVCKKCWRWCLKTGMGGIFCRGKEKSHFCYCGNKAMKAACYFSCFTGGMLAQSAPEEHQQ